MISKRLLRRPNITWYFLPTTAVIELTILYLEATQYISSSSLVLLTWYL